MRSSKNNCCTKLLLKNKTQMIDVFVFLFKGFPISIQEVIFFLLKKYHKIVIITNKIYAYYMLIYIT